MGPTWVNSPVLMEALLRYEQGMLPQQMRHWLRAVLEINDEQPLTGEQQGKEESA
ncbi:hypothetical protein [Synechococcus sp. UW140]|uniref:hypothetical protein n=1 Tax=Synechococcus sp. UW140 TaxID=368503 RepID=UPI00313847D7